MKNTLKAFLFGKKVIKHNSQPIVYIDIDRIGNAIERVDKIIAHLRSGNSEALTTWLIVRNKLRLDWEEAMLMLSHGKTGDTNILVNESMVK